MLPSTFIPARRRIGRGRRVATPPSAPTLIAATYDVAEQTVTLTFDRAIDVAGLDGSQVVVEDGNFNLIRYEATGAATMLGPSEVRIALVEVGVFVDPPAVFLNATGTSGIVAVVGGQAWAGVVGMELPFP